MKVQAPQNALDVLKEILENNQDKPQNVRVYFAGFACSGAVFSLALDEEQMSDTSYDLGGIHFIMDDNEYLTYGNVTISEVPPQGFVVSVDNPPQRDTGYSECGGSCCDGCSGC